MQLNINDQALKEYVKQLKAVHKSAMPVAIRNSLNSAAFDVKNNTMPDHAKAAFTQRKPTFFKANSKVDPAKGFAIRNMKASVGFIPKAGTDKSVDELEQQEAGGQIGGRSFITTPEARTGNNWDKGVKSDLRLRKIQQATIINAQKGSATSARQRFIKAAIMASKLYGKNAFILGNRWGQGNQTLSRIDKVTKNNKKRKIKIKRTPVYTYRPNRKVTIAGTNFMKRASHESGLKLGEHFQAAAIKQLLKYTNIQQ